MESPTLSELQHCSEDVMDITHLIFDYICECEDTIFRQIDVQKNTREENQKYYEQFVAIRNLRFDAAAVCDSISIH